MNNKSLIERVRDSSPTEKMFTSGYAPDGFSGFGVTPRNQLSWDRYGAALAYRLIPVLKSGVDKIAENLASVPLTIQDSDGVILARSDENPESSEFLSYLYEAYSEYGMPLTQLTAISLLLYGEAYIEKLINPHKFLRGYKWLNPLAMDVQARPETRRDETGRAYTRIDKVFRYSGYSDSQLFTEDEIIYLRQFDPLDDLRGYSPTLAAMSQANITLNFDRFMLAYYSNSGHPGVIVTPRDRALNPEQARSVSDEWRRNYRGVDSFFKTLVSPFPFDVTEFKAVEVGEPLTVSQDARRQILSALGVPPEIIGDTTNNPYQFSDETKRAFMQMTVRPLARQMEQAFNRSANLPEGVRVRFDFSEYDSVGEADKKRQELAQALYFSGAIPLARYQEMVEESITPGGDDVYLIPQSYVVSYGLPSEGGLSPLVQAQREKIEANAAGIPTNITAQADEEDKPSLPEPTRNAPANTTFSSVTYNGVTVQASPVRPSGRDDKKFERWVRHNGSERLIHWGQPGEQMERDNPASREAFESRHSCSEKKDPFAPGFWACWAWQPNAEVRGVTVEDIKSIASEYGLSLSKAWELYEAWQNENPTG